MTAQHKFVWLLALLTGLAASACERDTKVGLDGNSPPTFKLEGSGKVYFVRVHKSPTPAEEVYKNESGIWQINPTEEMRGTVISDYPEITYGRTPQGFVQVIPKNNAPPEPLREGQEYILLAPTYNANFEVLSFKVTGGKTLVLKPRQ